jgi:hypothetical protein
MSGLRHGAAQRRLAAHKHGCRLEIRPGGLAPPPLIIPHLPAMLLLLLHGLRTTGSGCLAAHLGGTAGKSGLGQ